MRAPNFDVSKVIEALEGTCDTIQEALEALYPGMNEDDLTKQDWDQIDSTIFLCGECGWWYEISRNVSDSEAEPKCDECLEDEEEDEVKPQKGNDNYVDEILNEKDEEEEDFFDEDF